MSVLKVRILKPSDNANDILGALSGYSVDHVFEDVVFIERPRKSKLGSWTSDVPGTTATNLSMGVTLMTPDLAKRIKEIQNVPYQSAARITGKYFHGKLVEEFEQQGGLIFSPEHVIFKPELAPKLGFNWSDMVAAVGRFYAKYNYKIEDGKTLLPLDPPYMAVKAGGKPKQIKNTADMGEAFDAANASVKMDGQLRQLVTETGIVHTFSSEADAKAITDLNKIVRDSGRTLPDVVSLLEGLVKEGPQQ